MTPATRLQKRFPSALVIELPASPGGRLRVDGRPSSVSLSDFPDLRSLVKRLGNDWCARLVFVVGPQGIRRFKARGLACGRW